MCRCLTWPVRDGALGGWDGAVCERASPACGPGVSFSSSCVCATGQTKDLENWQDSGTPKSSWLSLGAGSQLGAGRSPWGLKGFAFHYCYLVLIAGIRTQSPPCPLPGRAGTRALPAQFPGWETPRWVLRAPESVARCWRVCFGEAETLPGARGTGTAPLQGLAGLLSLPSASLCGGFFLPRASI